MKTSELKGSALDWAVAKIEYTKPVKVGSSTLMVTKDVPFDYHPSSNWAQGGLIIERERICLHDDGGDQWVADDNICKASYGETPLIAAMRCYVVSKLGHEVDIPTGFTQGESK